MCEEQMCTIDVEALRWVMSFEEYQRQAYSTIKPHDSEDMEKVDWALGLAGETGEVVELIKHNIMHKEPIDKAKLAKELGDICWYIAALCEVYGIKMDIVAELNIAKLAHRHNGGYSKEGSADRHNKEEKFSDTELYKELLLRLSK